MGPHDRAADQETNPMEGMGELGVCARERKGSGKGRWNERKRRSLSQGPSSLIPTSLNSWFLLSLSFPFSTRLSRKPLSCPYPQSFSSSVSLSPFREASRRDTNARKPFFRPSYARGIAMLLIIGKNLFSFPAFSVLRAHFYSIRVPSKISRCAMSKVQRYVGEYLCSTYLSLLGIFTCLLTQFLYNS